MDFFAYGANGGRTQLCLEQNCNRNLVGISILTKMVTIEEIKKLLAEEIKPIKDSITKTNKQTKKIKTVSSKIYLRNIS